MAASTVPALKANLVAAIKARPNMAETSTPPVLVTYDEPGKNIPDDVVLVGRVDRQSSPTQMMGGLSTTGSIEEHYLVEIVVSIYRGGDQAQTTFERACTVTDAVEVAVRSDPTIGGAVLEAWPQRSRFEPAWEDAHKGRITEVTIEIYCKAFI